MKRNKKEIFKEISTLLKKRNATIVAHYYTNPEIQELADLTGGCVSDSLEMAKFGKKSSSKNLIVAGVRFMGETAKILSPEKNVLMPNLEAECSLDIGCKKEEFSKFCKKYPKREVVVYANTSASIKAMSNWVVTSSIAIQIVSFLMKRKKKIIWAPDKNLGMFIKKKTGADMILWDGKCIVHEEFKIDSLKNMKKIYPKAAVFAHPESSEGIIQIADFVGSTKQIIQASKVFSNREIILATEKGILFKIKQFCPEKKFLIAPTYDNNINCKSCAECPWMKMNSIKSILKLLKKNWKKNEIHLEEKIRKKALIPLKKMINFSTKNY
ncbi:quinolinate synthase NadA [bacterium endosymbiont of Pedicinus badii]|uniref:quinolinate synthase NadA n=1 Tax=bacterium endosymbiont of Pedicinus badii TaxID=1719126 RepID=UPI0009BA8092|nr:quinolinate synthase NadA [bacterium endosymbiont of Pedicinus badii]OQM34328.1 quinolinate synthetase [bacterium endosymbiont of Pedicinus badii]